MRKYNVSVYATVLKDLPVLVEDKKEATQEELTQILVNVEVIQEIMSSTQFDVIIETLDAEVRATSEEATEAISKIFYKYFSKGGKLQ